MKTEERIIGEESVKGKRTLVIGDELIRFMSANYANVFSMVTCLFSSVFPVVELCCVMKSVIKTFKLSSVVSVSAL